MEEKICPYPGLRPFNEEESIFFRGREEHIQTIITQLQEKKFLMITGASGDGKSSIVYAGIIPNARAGFFKAKFNNWLIADFRPERSPLKNMAIAINDKLGYNDVNYVEKELSFGFSSLVNLYKKSPNYLNTAGAEYISLPEAEQKKLKRKAANLFILVDQFEEFFTNSENYNNGKAGVKSQLAVNLLLETAKIALAEELPIYIICTMRSDYVGQCAAFRGLPEYIGFSQFFVPRLKRKEMHQVIEEPAILSGNKISNRLIETLINDSEGQDQLPILQHALNRIWRAHAEEGAEEMDMIHYAKVGGLDRTMLPEEQKVLFDNWYRKQSEYKQRFLDEKASLSNVLNAHARELYEISVDYCRKHVGHDISREKAHELLKQIFTCLTKINDSRAVRNRATVEEVKQIVGKDIDSKLVEGLVNVFREPENTLLKPFIATNASAHAERLTDSDILDITHESLIRNWADLTEWTKKDNENVSIIEDLRKQVERWEERKRSKDYLLTIGSLSYFKSWYDSVNINPYWLAKYDTATLSPAQKLEKATAFMQPVKDFLRQSETVIKRSRRAVIAIAATIALVLIGFTTWAFKERGKAKEESAHARSAEMQANNEKQHAENSRKVAEKQTQIAEQKAKDEKWAQQLAFNEEREAKAAQRKAEAASEDARRNAERAKTEEAKAKEALAESEKLKEQAMQSKEEADKERKKAEILGNLSLARNVALKSDFFKNDPQMQGLMALQSYNIMIDNGGNSNEPIIYTAIRNAFNNLNKTDSSYMDMTAAAEQRTLQFNDDNTLSTADKKGLIYNWDTKKVGYTSLNPLFLLGKHSPIEVISFIEWSNILVTGHQNGTVMIWDVSNTDRKKGVKTLTGHNGPLRVIRSNKQQGLIATAAKDSLVIVWKYNGSSAELLKQLKFKTSVRDMQLSADGTTLFAVLDNGAFEVASISTGIITPIKNETGLWSVRFNRDKTLLAAGYADGKVSVFDPSKIVTPGGRLYSFTDNYSTVDEMAFDNDNKLLAVALADKSIKIYNLANKKINKPIEIRDIKGKTRAMAFNKDGRLYVLGSDHKIRRVEPSTKKMADVFCELLRRNMTSEEWSENIGETTPYEKTCKNK